MCVRTQNNRTRDARTETCRIANEKANFITSDHISNAAENATRSAHTVSTFYKMDDHDRSRRTRASHVVREHFRISFDKSPLEFTLLLMYSAKLSTLLVDFLHVQRFRGVKSVLITHCSTHKSFRFTHENTVKLYLNRTDIKI